MFVHRACMSGSDAGVAWRPLMVPSPPFDLIND